MYTQIKKNRFNVAFDITVSLFKQSLLLTKYNFAEGCFYFLITTLWDDNEFDGYLIQIYILNLCESKYIYLHKMYECFNAFEKS
jgi:hypothetical protein